MGEGLDALAEDFDYLHDALPPTLLVVLGDQVQRARAILAGRPREQVDYALESLDWMLREGDRFFEQAFHDGEHGDLAHFNRAKALQALQPHFDLAGQRDFPDASWPEYFALLALANLGEQLFVLTDPRAKRAVGSTASGDEAKLERIQTREMYLGEAAVEAMEAVCVAERMISEAALQARIASLLGEKGQSTKEAGRRGGKARAADFNKLRTMLLDYYDRHLTRRSNDNAAEILYEHFREEVDAVLSTADPAHRIAIWIGRHKGTGGNL